MEKIREKAERLTLLREDAHKALREELINERVFISEMNRKQLTDGKRATGVDMPEYVEGSKQPAAPGKIILFETGEFHEGIEPMFNTREVVMVGTDEKTGFLTAKYSGILGLTKENKRRLAERIKPNLIRRLKKMI